MNPKHVGVRLHPETGDLWLTEERYRQRPKMVSNINGPVLLALAADMVAVDGTRRQTRDVLFSDGTAIRITVEQIEKEEGDGDGDHS